MSVWRRRVAGVPVPDAVIGGCLVAAAAVTVLTQPWSGLSWLVLPASCATAACVALRRRAPRAMVAGTALGLLVLALLRPPGGTTMWAFVVLLVVAFSATAELAGRPGLGATAVLVAAGIAYDARLDANGLGSVVSPAVIVALPAAAGALLHRSREQARELARLAAELAGQREQVQAAAVLAERTRIARELHDVIAHTVGVMVVQAAAAERLLPGEHPAAEPVRAVRRTGKEAMAELRRVIGLLRTATDETPDPQPGLSDLPALFETARLGGPVEAQLDDGIPLPAGAALTVYRTAQEALTNARRHAPGCRVDVRLRRVGEDVVLTVDDDGDGPASSASGGYGLVGLAERAAAYGGTFSAGPRPDGRGWRVDLRLPVPTVDAAERP